MYSTVRTRLCVLNVVKHLVIRHFACYTLSKPKIDQIVWLTPSRCADFMYCLEKFIRYTMPWQILGKLLDLH